MTSIDFADILEWSRQPLTARCTLSDLPVAQCAGCAAGQHHSAVLEHAPLPPAEQLRDDTSTVAADELRRRRLNAPVGLATLTADVELLLGGFEQLLRMPDIGEVFGHLENIHKAMRRVQGLNRPPTAVRAKLGQHRDYTRWPAGSVGRYCWGDVFEPPGRGDPFCEKCGWSWRGLTGRARMVLEVRER